MTIEETLDYYLRLDYTVEASFDGEVGVVQPFHRTTVEVPFSNVQL